jgi:hypothetical protein
MRLHNDVYSMILKRISGADNDAENDTWMKNNAAL